MTIGHMDFKYSYFVSYAHSEGFGNCSINRDIPISSIADTKKIAAVISEATPEHKDVVVLWFTLFEGQERVAAIYTPPFRYEMGYIWDSENNMVADDTVIDSIARIRGWGRISYMENPEDLQDEIGILIAEILTLHWPKP